MLHATVYLFDYWYLLAISIDDWYLCERPSRTEKGKGKPRWKQLSTQFGSNLVCVCVLVTQSCLTLCNPMNYSPPGSSSMGFSRQEYLSGLPCPSPGDLPDLWIEPGSPALQVDSLPSEPSVYWALKVCETCIKRSWVQNMEKQKRKRTTFALPNTWHPPKYPVAWSYKRGFRLLLFRHLPWRSHFHNQPKFCLDTFSNHVQGRFKEQWCRIKVFHCTVSQGCSDSPYKVPRLFACPERQVPH